MLSSLASRVSIIIVFQKAFSCMARMVLGVWLQVRDALKTLEGLTAAARTDGMRPLEVLCTLFIIVVLHSRLVILSRPCTYTDCPLYGTDCPYSGQSVWQPVIILQRPVNDFSKDDLLQSETMTIL